MNIRNFLCNQLETLWSIGYKHKIDAYFFKSHHYIAIFELLFCFLYLYQKTNREIANKE